MAERDNVNIIDITEDDMSFWGFEEDLSSLACYAATEIDNLILQQDVKLKATSRLISEISEFGLISRQVKDSSGTVRKRLNPSTAVAFHCAISDTNIAQAAEKMADLGEQAKQIKERLEFLLNDPKKAVEEDVKKVEELRAFCIALSKRALSCEPSLSDLQPGHPHRM